MAATSAKKKTNTTTTSLRGAKCIPNVFLLGASKSGSTAVASWLFGEGICGGEVFEKYNEKGYFKKESHFFGTESRFKRGVDFYSEHYQHCCNENKPFIMDADPGNFKQADRFYKIYKDQPCLDALKFIMVVSEPISRDLSWYNHIADIFRKHRDPNDYSAKVAHDNGHGEIKTFSEYVAENLLPNYELGGLTSSSHYAHHMEPWYDYFEPKQILLFCGSPAMRP